MGNKSGRSRQYISLYLALSGLSLLPQLSACAPVQKTIADIQSQQQLSQNRYFLASGFFETVIQKSREVLKDNETRPPADLALYALGEVYANHAYRGKNYHLSRLYFEKLINNFPYSPLVSEAKTFVSLYEDMAAKDRLIASLEEQQAQALNESAAAAKVKVAKKTPESAPRPEGTFQETPPPSRQVVENKNFQEAVRNNERFLKEAGNEPPADEALYNLGLIYAHSDNPDKDYRKARDYFARLVEEFPGSPLAEEARVWLGLFGVFEKMQQIDLDIEEQKKQLNR